MFYYNIGTFSRQFGYGWEDTYHPGADLSDGQADYIWSDETATFWYDGQPQFMNEFRAMWTIEYPE